MDGALLVSCCLTHIRKVHVFCSFVEFVLMVNEDSDMLTNFTFRLIQKINVSCIVRLRCLKY